MKASKSFFAFALIVSAWLFVSCSGSNGGEKTVKNDPLKTHIFTLKNGLKVYLSVNKETPRIQTYIAVRIGGKNDPSETTGLAHYLEHIMFKGTKQYGTSNYEAEKPHLEKIEALFEQYRKETEDEKRKSIYAQIDSVSLVAAQYNIPNEFDKLMASIGASGTNAFTSYDQTIYVDNIPSNQVENWLKIESDRFKNMVIRGFHTELEAVYEEKNISLTKDFRKSYETMMTALFPNHPYGKQSVIGTQEHLKNPSITNIKNYFKKYYVANNIAICMAGDLDIDQTIKTIEKYFGDMRSNENLEKQLLPKIELTPIDTPIIKKVVGQDSKFASIAWRIPTEREMKSPVLSILQDVLQNGSCGIFDTDIIQKQKLLSISCGDLGLADHNAFMISADPKEGQTLDEAKELVLSTIAKLKKGEFDESIITATVNNSKLGLMSLLTSNSGRAAAYYKAFIAQEPWEEVVNKLNSLSKVTKQEVVDFANKYFGDNNYVVVYKEQGENKDIKKISKPKITPIPTNRDKISNFVKEIKESKVAPIEPVFVDFDKDMQKDSIEPGKAYFVKNDINEIFSLNFRFDIGDEHFKNLDLATSYFSYLGTDSITLSEFNKKMYELACSYSIGTGSDRMSVSLSGLNENMGKALVLLLDLLKNCKVDNSAYENLVKDIIKSRRDAKSNQQSNFKRLQMYATYGKVNPATYILSEKELTEKNPQELVDLVHSIFDYPFTSSYYGPSDKATVKKILSECLPKPKQRLSIPEKTVTFKIQETKEPIVYIAPYKANNFYATSIANSDQLYDKTLSPFISLYNSYFGSGMNGIVFQEIRESKALAYSAYAGYVSPSRLDIPYYMVQYLVSQNDKLKDGITTFEDITNNMPLSEKTFSFVKKKNISNQRTTRVRGLGIINYYLGLKDLGITKNPRKEIFEKIQNMTLKDVEKFQQERIKGQTRVWSILGDEKELDMDFLNSKGKVVKLTTEEIFGY